MKRSLRTFLGEEARPVGTLRYDAQGARESLAFEYAAEWLATPERFAIDPQLKLLAGPQFHRKSREGSVFPGAVADTEPDGWARRVILRDHAKQRGGSAPLNSLDVLLAVDDLSRVGALRFQDEEGAFQHLPNAERRTAPLLIELSHLLHASQAVEKGEETAADLAGGIRSKHRFAALGTALLQDPPK